MTSGPKTPMTGIGAIRAYIYGCKKAAEFTLVSVKTGARYTYRFRRKNTFGFFFVDVLTGDDNEEDFSFVGTVRRARPRNGRPAWEFGYSAASNLPDSAPSVLAVDWFVELTNRARDLNPKKIEFWHSGKCSRCGKTLTVPASLSVGMGPKCRAKANEAAAAA